MDNDKCWLGCGEAESLLQNININTEYKTVQFHWKKRLAILQITKQSYYMTSYFTHRYIPLNNESTYLHKNFHRNNILTLLHSNVLHNSPKEETKWMFINWWVYVVYPYIKHNVVYPYNTVLFGSKKEWSTDTCYNMMNLVTLYWVKENTCLVYLYRISNRHKLTETK